MSRTVKLIRLILNDLAYFEFVKITLVDQYRYNFGMLLEGSKLEFKVVLHHSY
jgi:hypothetical protein